MEFISFLWYVKHLLIWSLISNIYKFILIYIIMIVFSWAKSLLVYLSRVYSLPRLLRCSDTLGNSAFHALVGFPPEEGEKMSRRANVCPSWNDTIGMHQFSRAVCAVCDSRLGTAAGAVLGPRCLWLEREREQAGAPSPASSLGTGMSFLAGAVEQRVWPLVWRRAGGDQTHVRLVSSSRSAVHLCRLLVFVLRGLFLQGLLKVKFPRVSFPFPSLLFLISLMLWKDIILNITHALPSSEWGHFEGAKDWFQDLRGWELTVLCSKKACTERKRCEPWGFTFKMELKKNYEQ